MGPGLVLEGGDFPKCRGRESNPHGPCGPGVFKTIDYWKGSAQNDEMSQTIVEVIYSPERNARVQVFRRGNGTFGFEEERFQKEEQCWIPFGRYSEAIIDSLESAVREAAGRVSWLADALKPKAYSLSWVRTVSGDPAATFIPTDTLVFNAVAADQAHPEGLGERLSAKQILRVGGLYLVETVEKVDEWYIGDRKGEGPIYCWGSYGSLPDAIKSL